MEFVSLGKQKTRSIVKSNQLIEAKYKLTLNEQRLILLLITLIKPEDKEFKIYKFKIQDFIKIFRLRSKTTSYKEIKTTTERLVGNTLIMKPNSSRTLYINWLSSAEYFENEGYVELCFDPKLKPYLLQLKDHFTTYRLENVLHLKSIYSIRLYELLLKEHNYYYRQKNSLVFELQRLKEILGIEKKEYVKFNHFKTRVLNSAQKELKEKSDIFFDYNCLKTGRKITAIEFVVKINNIVDPRQTTIEESFIELKNSNIKNFPTTTPPVEKLPLLAHNQEKLVQDLLLQGFQPEKDAVQIIQTIPEQEVKNTLDVLKQQQGIKKIKSPGGWLRKAFEDRRYKKTETELKQEAEQREKKEKQKEFEELKGYLEGLNKEFEQQKKERISDYYWQKITPEEQEFIKNNFYEKEVKDSGVLSTRYKKDFNGIFVQSAFHKFINETVLNFHFADFIKDKGYVLEDLIQMLNEYLGCFGQGEDMQIRALIKKYQDQILSSA